MLIILLFINKYSYLFDNNYYVYFLDVSQGDCAVIITPKNNDVIMIDTGGLKETKKENWQVKNNDYMAKINYHMQ